MPSKAATEARKRLKQHQANLDEMAKKRGAPNARHMGNARRSATQAAKDALKTSKGQLTSPKSTGMTAPTPKPKTSSGGSLTRTKGMIGRAGEKFMGTISTSGSGGGKAIAGPVLKNVTKVAGPVGVAATGFSVGEMAGNAIRNTMETNRQKKEVGDMTRKSFERNKRERELKDAMAQETTSVKPANKPAKSKAGPTSKGNANTNIKTSSDSTKGASKSSTVTVPKYKDQGTAVTYGTKPAPVVEKSKPARKAESPKTPSVSNAGYDNYERIMSSHGLAQGGPVRRQYGVNVSVGPKLNKQYGRKKV